MYALLTERAWTQRPGSFHSKKGSNMNILAIGDVVSKPGLDTLRRLLRTLKKQHAIDFTIVNGENASGVGITPIRQMTFLMPV